MKNGLCDAFELLGGCSVKENNLQVALYYSLQKDSLKMPIVGSSDSHTTMPGAQWFDEDSTVLFEKDGDTIGAIDGGYSVAVESVQGEEIRVFGDFRMMKYTHFLIENLFCKGAPRFAMRREFLLRGIYWAIQAAGILFARARTELRNLRMNFLGDRDCFPFI